MSASPSSPLRRTPLWERHRALGGKMVPFGGWDMPVEYSGLAEEHRAVRERAGLFDVSHMGEIRVRGPKAFETVQRLTCNDVAALVDGLLTYRIAADDYLLVVNASNTPKDVAWAKQMECPGAAVEDESPVWAQLAPQGPRA